MSLIWFPWSIHNGWTSFRDPLIRFPIIRLAISGLPNVMVFFVISGYALSHKPLRLLRQDRRAEAYDALASSTFRRHPRLFLPAVLLCLPCILAAYAGVYGDGARMPGAAVPTQNPPRCATPWQQVRDFAAAAARLCDPFSGGAIGWAYNNALWTLPVEFRGSLVVFGLLLALARVRSAARLSLVLLVAIYCLCFAHWAEFLFVGGMLVADLQFATAETGEDWGLGLGLGLGLVLPEGHGAGSKRPRRIRAIVAVALRWWRRVLGCRALQHAASLLSFLGALYVLGMPKLDRGGADTPGYRALAALIPERWRTAGSPDHFWPAIAAVWLVWTIGHAPFLQRALTCRFAQYLGRISYPLYLVHLPMLHSFGFRMGKAFLGLTGSDTEVRYLVGVAMAAAVVWVMVVWVADLGWRFVDVKVVGFAAWGYGRLGKRTGGR